MINKIQQEKFTIVMCALMVAGMSVYNAAVLAGGLLPQSLMSAIPGFVPGFLVALVGDVFYAGPLSNRVLGMREWRSRTIMKSIFMVCLMVPYMSCYGAAMSMMHGAPVAAFPQLWAKNVLRNVVMALPLQLLVVGPAVRYLFSRLYTQSKPRAGVVFAGRIGRIEYSKKFKARPNGCAFLREAAWHIVWTSSVFFR